jgi:predicted glycogen debranching enzyme
MDLSPVPLEKEWLETNGLGGFACSTICGRNTRRYHGLLTAALKPPVERYVLLSKLEETLIVDGARFDLSSNFYAGAIHPRGDELLFEFRRDPWPVFVYRAGGVEIEKRLFLVHGENALVVEYELRTPHPGATLDVRPLTAFRDYHSTTHWNESLDRSVRFEEGIASVKPYASLPELHIAHNARQARASGDWYYHFEYPFEKERGFEEEEDLFNPFELTFDLSQTAAMVVSTERRHAGDAAGLREAERSRRAAIAAGGPLALAADQFIVARGDRKTIVAGYPWFTDWGRDSMIALPGLTLATRRFQDARDTLEEFAQSMDRGMLPNRFPDAGEVPEYNTADATLWFFESARAYLEASGDEAFVRDTLYEKLREALEWHVAGTRYGIRAEDNGLLRCGEPGVQLTWMDAKIGDWVVTPRTGMPVEIQALWYNALCVMADFAARFDDPEMTDRASALAGRAKSSFLESFWNAELDCLYDVVDGDTKDASIRPNQIFAVSLPHTMLDGERAAKVVAVVERDLLTPMGLRTLSPNDPNYRGRYEGGVRERDSAYHQGTVWPWLIGPFIDAWKRVHPGRDASRFLAPLLAHLDDACLGQISEIADGDAPHTPRGCFAQAWSVAEALRAATPPATFR